MNKLKKARKLLNHTQEEAARIIGTTYMTYHRWEKKGLRPRSYLYKVALKNYIKSAKRKKELT